MAVSVEALQSANPNIFPTDNFCVQLSFDDGSLCSLIYTSIGHMKLGKERMELFFDGKSIVMDDYLELKGYGLPSSFDARVSMADKGHASLIQQFFASLRKPTFEPPI